MPLTVFREVRGRASISSEPRAMCGVGRGEQLAVDVDGQVHGCLTFVESDQPFPTAFLRSRVEALRLGDLRGADLAENLRAYPAAVERAGIFSNHQRRYSSGTLTARSAVTWRIARSARCRSACTAGADGDPDRIPDFHCAYNLVSLKYRARFPSQPSAAEILGLSRPTTRVRRRSAVQARRPIALGVAARNAGSGHGPA